MSALHRCCQTSLLPKADKPYPDKEEGQNKAEKELAVENHGITFVFFAKVTIDAVLQHNVTRLTLSIADRKRIRSLSRSLQRIGDRTADLFGGV